MTVFLLVRHAATDFSNLALAGRTPNLHLSPEGGRQAERLRELLELEPVTAIYSSPLERAVETAKLLAADSNLPVRTDEFLAEIDYGEWTGLSFAELKSDERWQAFNTFRSRARIPGGESAVFVQERMVTGLEHLAWRHPEQVVALVTHLDPIRLAICHYAGIPVDLSLRIAIEPASVSAVAISRQEVVLLGLNRTVGFEKSAAKRAEGKRHQVQLVAP
ncbi:MAG TPA: histidine phosphatase family protein [Terriglobia bacterium]|nr:histidine phosphatase family protein [Terriglobia bacterium]